MRFPDSHAVTCKGQETKFCHTRLARRTRNTEVSPSGRNQWRLCTEEHAAEQRLQGGAAITAALSKSLGELLPHIVYLTLFHVSTFSKSSTIYPNHSPSMSLDLKTKANRQVKKLRSKAKKSFAPFHSAYVVSLR